MCLRLRRKYNLKEFSLHRSTRGFDSWGDSNDSARSKMLYSLLEKLVSTHVLHSPSNTAFQKCDLDGAFQINPIAH